MRGLILIALSLPAFAQGQTLPAAPQVTVGTPLLKVLQFNWLPVPGATLYQLHYKPDASSAFTPFGNPILAPRALATVTIPVHAFDWVNARYKVSACNAAGCQDSAEIPVVDLMLSSIGYIKASNPGVGDGFGRFAQISQDGNTLITSSHDDSSATGVNGNQSDNSSEDSGAVYVFRRIGAGWRQTAYLKPDVNFPQQYFGIGYPLGFRALSVSADGSLVAVGAPGEERNGVQFAGAVYLFARAADGRWSQAEKFTLPAPAVFDFFGVSVDLSSDGLYLKVAANRYDAQDRPMADTYIYRHGEAGWVPFAKYSPEPDDVYCSSQMSGDTSAIISVCDSAVNGPHLRARRRVGAAWNPVQDIPLPSNLTQISALSGNGARLAIRTVNAAGQREVRVYSWTGSAWVQEAALESPGNSATDYPSFGQELALNRNGTMLAVGDYTNDSGGAGVSDSLQPPAPPPALNKQGAVFVYRRGAGTPRWTLTKVVKAPNPAFADAFGQDVSLSGNGLTMAVGAGGEDSKARGVDGDQTNNGKPTSGAVYLY